MTQGSVAVHVLYFFIGGKGLLWARAHEKSSLLCTIYVNVFYDSFLFCTPEAFTLLHFAPLPVVGLLSMPLSTLLSEFAAICLSDLFFVHWNVVMMKHSHISTNLKAQSIHHELEGFVERSKTLASITIERMQIQMCFLLILFTL